MPLKTIKSRAFPLSLVPPPANMNARNWGKNLYGVKSEMKRNLNNSDNDPIYKFVAQQLRLSKAIKKKNWNWTVRTRRSGKSGVNGSRDHNAPIKLKLVAGARLIREEILLGRALCLVLTHNDKSHFIATLFRPFFSPCMNVNVTDKARFNKKIKSGSEWMKKQRLKLSKIIYQINALIDRLRNSLMFQSLW